MVEEADRSSIMDDWLKHPPTFFERWFARPVKTQSKIENGDGAPVAMIASCALNERFAVAKLHESGIAPNEDSVIS